MIGVVVGGGLAGVLLVVSALVGDSRPRPALTRRVTSRARVHLDAAGMTAVRLRQLAAACVAGGLLAGALGWWVTGAAPPGVVFACFGAYAPLAFVSSRARAQRRELAEVWPETVDHVASGVRAGLSLAECLSGLADRGPEPLRPAFAAFARDYQASGRLDSSLAALKDRLADPVADRVVEGLRVARQVGGGDLGRVLRNLAEHLRDDLRTRSELEARQAWVVNGARLAVAAPWAVLLLMCLQREVASRYTTTAGVGLLAGGALVCLVAYRAMVRLGRLPLDQRVLVDGGLR